MILILCIFGYVLSSFWEV
ncbi:hypothetical protein F383_18734 [Gossypium arboreum]|uniref:Uncharacterized protein n=1 Tax=Gossypium arboreum TaxID=29729 RepID=A0A0B0ME11_GOSAR|nr:hypothetical protein F383_18734 [Gossypium arboreum]